MEPLPLDYGGFNPTFLGASITVGSNRALTLLLDDWAERPTTAADLLRLPMPEAFSAMATLSVLAHELRHFHDFLVTPVGSLTFWNRLMAYLDSGQLLVTLIQEHDRRPYNCLPVPLPLWSRMPPEARAARLAALNRVLALQGQGPLVVPELTEVLLDAVRVTGGSRIATQSTQDLREFVETVDRRYDRLRRLASVTEHLEDLLITPFHLLEASAVLVQIQELLKGYGGACASLFLEGIGLGRQRSVYTDVLQLLTTTGLVRNRRDLGVEQLSVAVGWCLLGDPLAAAGSREEAEAAIEGSSSAARFGLLWRHLLTDGFPQAGDLGEHYVRRWFAEWDQLLGSGVSSLDNLAASTRRDERQLARLIGLHEHNQRSGGYAYLAPVEEILGAAQQFVDARRWVVQRYLEDPDAYLTPLTYLESLGTLERAPLKLRLDGGTVRGSLVRDVYLSEKGDDGREYPVIVEPAMETTGVAHLTPKVAFDLYSKFTMADVLFSGFGRDRIDQYEHLMVKNALFKGQGVHFMNV